jgi:hypothetical protein
VCCSHPSRHCHCCWRSRTKHHCVRTWRTAYRGYLPLSQCVYDGQELQLHVHVHARACCGRGPPANHKWWQQRHALAAARLQEGAAAGAASLLAHIFQP